MMRWIAVPALVAAVLCSGCSRRIPRTTPPEVIASGVVTAVEEKSPDVFGSTYTYLHIENELPVKIYGTHKDIFNDLVGKKVIIKGHRDKNWICEVTQVKIEKSDTTLVPPGDIAANATDEPARH